MGQEDPDSFTTPVTKVRVTPKWEGGYVRIIKVKSYFSTVGITYGFYHLKTSEWRRIRTHPERVWTSR